VKIDGKFYPLQNQEWVKICKSLTKSQIGVLYYLRSLDPYGNGMRVKASSIATDLGITKRSVNAAIAVLEEKGYINLEDIDYSVKLSAGGCLCGTVPTVTLVGNSFPTREENFPPENKNSHLGTEFPTEEENFPSEKRISHLESESLTQQESQSSKINKTYSDFIQTLSEDERENFLNFCEEKTKNLSQPVNDIEAWLAHTTKAGKNRWEVYYGKYLGFNQTHSKKPTIKNPLDEHRRELEEQQQQAKKAWEQSKNQNEE
jgi:Helix-turn-helix domain